MNLVEDFKEKVKEKASDVLSDTSQEGEIKRLGIPIYLSGILLAIMGANYIFNFKAELIAMIAPDYYSNFLAIVNIIFDVLLFVFVSSSVLSMITLILHGLLFLFSRKIRLLENPASALKKLSQGADYRTDSTSTWLLLFFLLMAATQPGKIMADIDQILLFFSPIWYFVYLTIIPTIVYTFTNTHSLVGRFLSRPIKIFINSKAE